MNDYNPVIAPFVYLIRQIFLFSYDLTGNYGVSVVLLSFAISLLLLPIFILIEKAKKKDDAVKQKMKPQADEIKRCYKGQERYYYLRTLNRQYNYHPVRALIPTLSLLLQIPFFIAAYQYLEHFEPLRGVGLLFIHDLSAPDGLMGSINILPVIMTVVNLITAFFYTRNGNASERIQMLVVAGIFLVLLFNLPSGLVLYWTMNNVFSFFRLFITNPEVFKRRVKKKELTMRRQHFIAMLPKLKGTFVFITIILLLVQFNRAFQNSFHKIGLRIISSLGAGLLITLLLAGVSLLHNVGEKVKIKGLKNYYVKYVPVFRPMFIIIGLIAVLFEINWAIQYNFDDIGLRLMGAVTGSAFLTMLLAMLVLYYKGHLDLSATKFHFRLSYFGNRYILVFWLFFAIASCTQINWALLVSSFKAIIPRLSVTFIVSWITTVLIANMIYALKNNDRFTIKELKSYFKLTRIRIILTFIIILTVAVASQINWALNFSFEGIVWRLIIALFASVLFTSLIGLVVWLSKMLNWQYGWLSEKSQIFFSLLFSGLYFHLVSIFYYAGFNSNLSYLANCLIIPAWILGGINFKKKKHTLKASIWYSFFVLFVLLFGIQLFNLWASSYNKGFILDIFHLKSSLGDISLVHFTNLGILIAIILSFFYYKRSEKKEKNTSKNALGIYLLAIFYLAGFIFLWNPLATYSTFPDNFNFPAIEIVKHNFKLFAIAIGGLFILYTVLPKKFKVFWLIFILTLTCIGFIHNTLLPIDLGTLQQSRFVDQDNLAQPVHIYILEAISILGIIFFINWILKKGFFKQIGLGLILLNVILISQSLFASVGTGSFMNKPKIITDFTHTISFSKNKENVIFLLTDMFHGWYINRILNENPKLKEVFSGFMYYPNTLSVSYTTAGTLPPLLGGYNKTIDKLNQDENRTFEDKITDISIDFYNKIKSNGYQFTSTKIIYSRIDKNLFDSYLPDWDESWDQWNSELKIGISKEIGYTLLWENAAFYTSPLFLKPVIYNKGNWLHGDVTSNENTNEAKPYNFLRLLPYISHTNNDKPNFIFLYSTASHHPWDIIDESGVMHNLDAPYKNNEWVMKTLASWINWMKTNDVYDNTKIIIVSDHGPHWRSNYSREIAGNMPIKNNPSLKIEEKRYMGMFPLLMTKDFNQDGELKKDNRFMSNVDAYYFAFNENNPIRMDPSGQRELPFTIVYWETKLWLKNKVSITARGKVKDNVFDLNNWTLIPDN